MGRWNRRYLPRKKSRHYDYEDPPSSPPRHYGNASGGVPSWEIDYCKSARVPWHKILASKKYIYCYPSVLNWDASAGEEALQEAKQRYWAMINGLPCNNPLPNPDMYIDDIDWNPYVDPELMEELDLPVFDPDKAQNDEKLETINEEVDKNQSTDDNPWERNQLQSTASLKDAVNGWGTWGDPVNIKHENPWEQNCSQVVDSLKDNAWRSGNDSWERNQLQSTASLKDAVSGWGTWGDSVNINNENPWEQNCSQAVDSLKDNAWRSGNDSRGNECGNSWNNNNNYNVRVRPEGWGNGEKSSWNWNSGNLGNYKYSGDNYNSKERGWRENKNNSWGWKGAEHQSNEPRNWDSRNFQRGRGNFRGNFRKREGSSQHTSKFKSSRYNADTYGSSHQF